MKIDNLLPKWLKWLNGIENTVITLQGDRQILRKTVEIVEANPATLKPNVFVKWFIRHYDRSAAVSVRTLADQQRGVVSLVNLLDHMRKHASVITWEWFLGQYVRDDPTGDELVRQAWTKKAKDDFQRWGGQTHRHVACSVLRKDRTEVITAVKRVKDHVDKHIAHRYDGTVDLSKFKATHADLDAAIDVIAEKTCLCISLLRQAGSINMLNPSIIGGWTRVFRIPWKKTVDRQ